MKKIAFLSIFITTLSFGQFFDSNEQPQEETNTNVFSQQNQAPQPEMGLDANPDENPGGDDPFVPIDDWMFLLPLAGAAVGYYYLRKHKNANSAA